MRLLFCDAACQTGDDGNTGGDDSPGGDDSGNIGTPGEDDASGNGNTGGNGRPEGDDAGNNDSPAEGTPSASHEVGNHSTMITHRSMDPNTAIASAKGSRAASVKQYLRENTDCPSGLSSEFSGTIHHRIMTFSNYLDSSFPRNNVHPNLVALDLKTRPYYHAKKLGLVASEITDRKLRGATASKDG